MSGNQIDLIVCPMHDWKKYEKEGFRTRDAHLIKGFEKNNKINKILVIDRPTSLPEMIYKRSNWRVGSGSRILSEKNFCITRVSEKVFVLDIFVPNIIKVITQKKKWWNSIFEDEIIISKIRYSIDYLEMNDAILFLQNPMTINIAKSFPKNSFIFDAIDNWIYHPQMEGIKEIVEKNYIYIKENAQIIFTVSEGLRDFFYNSKDNVVCVKNGVDKEFFSINKHNCDKGNSYKIGYMGKMQERLDLELIDYCAKKMPQCEFVFAGPILGNKKAILSLEKNNSNVKFIGDIKYDRLPEFLDNIDIGIIPHIVDKFTNSMNPLKIYEYLASGKPVVTTNVSGVNDISKYVKIAKSNEEFYFNLKKLISELDNYKIDELSVKNSLNDSFTWDYKIDEIISNIYNY